MNVQRRLKAEIVFITAQNAVRRFIWVSLRRKQATHTIPAFSVSGEIGRICFRRDLLCRKLCFVSLAILDAPPCHLEGSTGVWVVWVVVLVKSDYFSWCGWCQKSTNAQLSAPLATLSPLPTRSVD